MKHTMHLQPQPFSMIRSGEKTIELRLYDEKRQQIAVDDEIEFCCPESGQNPFTVRVKATASGSRNFAELYATLPAAPMRLYQRNAGKRIAGRYECLL